MRDSTWHRTYAAVAPHVVKICTPGGSGTGFLFSNFPGDPGRVGIGTAAHVVAHAHEWGEPIRIEHVASGKSLVLRPDDRRIKLKADWDTAALLFAPGPLPLPEKSLDLIPSGQHMMVGGVVGWLGFPAIRPAVKDLCFFSGPVSCHLEDSKSYLIDGVAINGVSGGPAVYVPPDRDPEDPLLVGVVSAYIPNRATGEALPGVCMVQEVVLLQILVAAVRDAIKALEEETGGDEESASPPAD